MSMLKDVKIFTRYVGESDGYVFIDSNKWYVKLIYNEKSIEVPFYVRKIFRGSEPELTYVLNSMFSDATVIYMDFEEFCDEFGYSGNDFDKIIYETCFDYYYKLKELFGEDFEKVKDEIFHSPY